MPGFLTGIVVGFAPWWLAALIWLIISGASVLVWRAIRDQDRREQRRRARRYGDHERRLRRIERHLFHDDGFPYEDAFENDGTEHHHDEYRGDPGPHRSG